MPKAVITTGRRATITVTAGVRLRAPPSGRMAQFRRLSAELIAIALLLERLARRRSRSVSQVTGRISIETATA